MSKQIYLYSEDKKYKCAVELADTCDKFGCPDHSMIILTEERPDGTYVIAQAKDRILETKKDKQIANLQHQLEVAEYALDLMSGYAINDNDLYDLVSDFNIENERYDKDHFGIDTCDVVDYFKEQAESELKGEKE